MSRRSVELLLVENVENLGIVGDVVKVKPGYARNFLLPAGFAEAPSEERLTELQERRKQVQEELARLRKEREELNARLAEVELSIVRSCNDQGLLYGSVTQRDIADALQEAGYAVEAGDVRLGQPIKRVGIYPVPIQFDKDLRTEITFNVEPDHPIGEEREEMEFDDEGNLIERKPRRKKKEQSAKGEGEAKDDAEAAPAARRGESPPETEAEGNTAESA